MNYQWWSCFWLLQDITELEKLQFLTSLSELSLIDNPVSSRSGRDAKPTLNECTNDQISKGMWGQIPASMIWNTLPV